MHKLILDTLLVQPVKDTILYINTVLPMVIKDPTWLPACLQKRNREREVERGRGR